MSLGELRAEALERDNHSCSWPACSYEIDGFTNKLETAHLSHRGMGGADSKNTLDNVLILCTQHHNCLDGRTGLGTLRLELAGMLRHVNHIHR